MRRVHLLALSAALWSAACASATSPPPTDTAARGGATGTATETPSATATVVATTSAQAEPSSSPAAVDGGPVDGGTVAGAGDAGAPTSLPPAKPPFVPEEWVKERGLAGIPKQEPCWYWQPIVELPPEQLYRCECEVAPFPGREVLQCFYLDQSNPREQAPILSRVAFFAVRGKRLVLAFDLPISSMLDVDCPPDAHDYCMMRIAHEIEGDGLVVRDEHNRCGPALKTLRARLAKGQVRRQQLQRAQAICDAVGRYRWQGERLVREWRSGQSGSSAPPRSSSSVPPGG